ncbi:MAG: NAD(P)/FAD-dependent oxidoreductase [Frankiales bacterium]|nr:NAD(P)/FAD-dependent oxidoreductase [Frankiales bacterium]
MTRRTVPRTDGHQLRRVVVVGNGMAGARAVEELCLRDPDVLVTVFGAEDRPAYNRVLLSDVLAGKRRHDEIALTAAPGRVVQRLGVAVVSVDRRTRTVTSSDGATTPYDALVLATGSTALVPPVQGIAGPDGRLLEGVHVFRTLDDCSAITAAAGSAKRAVVVGGGLLGLEAARGLLRHGLSVEVVHGAGHLMETQLDPTGGAVLRRAVEALGVGVHLGSFAAGVTGGRRVTGVRLADGRQVEADLVVLACGIRPQVHLARAAGLAVERAVLVDDLLRTDDPHVYAIGECAQHRGTVYGLVAPAWEQAAVLADLLTGRAAAYGGSKTITRLKAMDLELAAMGDTTPELADCRDDVEVLVFADPVRHVYKKVVVTAGVVTGAILLGDLSTAGPLTQAFDRATPLPAERLHLMFSGLGTATEVDPATLADDAVVCTCNQVSAGAVRSCSARTVAEVALATRATTGCGGCRSLVEGLLCPTPALERRTA